MKSLTAIRKHISEISIKYDVPNYILEPIYAIIQTQQGEINEARQRALSWRREYVDVKRRVVASLKEPKLKKKESFQE